MKERFILQLLYSWVLNIRTINKRASIFTLIYFQNRLVIKLFPVRRAMIAKLLKNTIPRDTVGISFNKEIEIKARRRVVVQKAI